jgi:hypothetical protein
VTSGFAAWAWVAFDNTEDGFMVIDVYFDCILGCCFAEVKLCSEGDVVELLREPLGHVEVELLQ